MYSAIKINGKKAYEYARNNQSIKLEPRNIEIKKIKLISFANNVITYEVTCTKGTYIRVLCEDIAKKIGTVGLMQNLTRTEVNNFKIEDSLTLEEIHQNGLDIVKKKIITIEKVFYGNRNISLNNRELELFLNGVLLTNNNEEGVYKIYNQENFIGLGTIKNNLLKRDVILK